MLRRTFFALIFLTLIIFGATALFAQANGSGETVLSQCWRFPADGVTSLQTAGGQVFATLVGGSVISLSSTGEKLWQTDLGGEIEPQISLVDGFVIVSHRSGAADTSFHRLSVDTGLPVDVTTVASPNGAVGKTVSVSGVLIEGDDHGAVIARSESGTLQWKFKTGGAITTLLPTEQAVVVISRDNFVYSLEARNGGLRWKRRLPGRAARFALSANSLLVAAVDQHGVSLIDTVSGRVLGQVVLEGEEEMTTDPVPTSNGFILATDTGLRAYSPLGCGQNGNGSRTPLSGNRPQKQF